MDKKSELKNTPNKVVLHCADTPDTIESITPVTKIDEWHKARGWSGIGYHYYITRDGVVHLGRKEDKIGAHTLGQNKDSLGICCEGRNFPSVPQILSLIGLYKSINKNHKIGYENWFGHYEFTSNKTCPGFNMSYFRQMLSHVRV